jgi:hypothetical protein
MRKSTVFFIFVALNVILFLLMLTHASVERSAAREALQEKMEMVKRYELTDLCLFTEASYIRHLSQADLHTAFQDSPMSLEHFPSGSLVPPPLTLAPKRIREKNGKVD